MNDPEQELSERLEELRGKRRLIDHQIEQAVDVLKMMAQTPDPRMKLLIADVFRSKVIWSTYPVKQLPSELVERVAELGEEIRRE